MTVLFRKYLDVIEVTERVAKGGAFLTEKYGAGWPDKVDLECLQMQSTEDCIAGQLVGDFYTAMEEWFNEHVADLAMPQAVAHGFDLDESEYNEDNWDLLTSAWVGLITVQRSRDGALV